jgi:hypothetical protein
MNINVRDMNMYGLKPDFSFDNGVNIKKRDLNYLNKAIYHHELNLFLVVP